MKILFISDTHSLHNEITDFLPNADCIIISGDISRKGRINEVTEFLNWVKNLPHKYKVFIAGNHDFSFEERSSSEYHWLTPLLGDKTLEENNVIYLEDSFFLLEHGSLSRPIKIYGSPWQPEFHNWAFNLPRFSDELNKKWLNIPDDTDILVTHGPPNQILDFNFYNHPCGCELLRSRVMKVKPLIHAFGHIHEGYGMTVINDITFINSSICDYRYNPINSPILIEIKEENNKLIITNVETR